MNRQTNLDTAFSTWLERRSTQDEGELPIASGELYEFLLDPEQHPRKEEILAILGESAEQLAELGEMMHSQRLAAQRLEQWYMALPKAAAEAGENQGRFTTEGGKYTIEIRPHLTQPGRGVVVVRVAAAFQEAVEGQVLVLEDSEGVLLLKGKVVDGQVSQEVESLRKIGYGFVIRVVQAEA